MNVFLTEGQLNRLIFEEQLKNLDSILEGDERGNAKKIHQGKGPFVFTFKKILSKAQKKKLNKVYINIDGEFYHLVQPKQIVISLNDKISNGQIKFLKKGVGKY